MPAARLFRWYVSMGKPILGVLSMAAARSMNGFWLCALLLGIAVSSNECRIDKGGEFEPQVTCIRRSVAATYDVVVGRSLDVLR